MDVQPNTNRFWAKTKPDGDCIVWTASVSGSAGQVRWDGTTRRSPDVAWQLATGQWPSSPLVARPTCGQALCVAPSHLALVRPGQREDPTERFWRQVDRSGDGCWPWVGSLSTWGYGTFWFDGKGVGSYRMVWALTHGDPPTGMFVCHSCDNPPCCNPSHLWLGTQRQNDADRHQKGRTVNPVGERHGQSKLTDAAVLEAIELRAQGWLIKDLAARYGVSYAPMSEALAGKTWRHLQRHA